MTKLAERNVSKTKPGPANEWSTDDRLMSAFGRGEVDAAEALFLRFAPWSSGSESERSRTPTVLRGSS